MKPPRRTMSSACSPVSGSRVRGMCRAIVRPALISSRAPGPGGSERTAQNFMSVAERFKSAKFAELPIQPSAAYLLAAPAVPDEARQVAIEKAEAGEEITVATAREIVAEAKKKRRPRRQKAVPADKLGVRLIKTLRKYQEGWPGKLSGLVRRQREFAAALEMRSKKKARG